VEATIRTRDWGDLRLLFRFGPDGIAGVATSNSNSSNNGAP